MDPDKFLYRLNSGKKLKASELTEVVNKLGEFLAASEPAWDDCYGLILVLQRAGAREHHALVASFLDQRDSLLVSLALETLCLEWGLTDEYLERVLSFSLGVPWDLDGDLRSSAFEILGEYINHKRFTAEVDGITVTDRVVRRSVKLLIKAFEDRALDLLVRRASYRALCRAAGLDQGSIPSAMSCFSLNEGSSDIDWSIVNYWRNFENPDSSESASFDSSRVTSDSLPSDFSAPAIR